MNELASIAFVLGLVVVLPPEVSASTDGVAAPDGDEADKRGCCSHHGGVCGCSTGRAKCCDGAMSPTCGCAVPEGAR